MPGGSLVDMNLTWRKQGFSKCCTDDVILLLYLSKESLLESELNPTATAHPRMNDGASDGSSLVEMKLSLGGPAQEAQESPRTATHDKKPQVALRRSSLGQECGY